MFVNQAHKLVDGLVRGVVLDWPSECVARQHTTREMTTAIAGKFPFLSFGCEPRGHATLVGLERFRLRLNGASARSSTA